LAGFVSLALALTPCGCDSFALFDLILRFAHLRFGIWLQSAGKGL